jgi:predicted phage baseplate assembly protein
MSRPPRPPFRDSPSGDQRGATATLDYVKLEFADLYRLALDAAKDDAGMQLPGGGDDVTATLFELPSLIGHVLATYQDLYAGEAYISSAQSARSLVRHGRRLAYIPDGGLSATGYVVLTIKDGLTGRIPEGFALSSTPAGEQKAGTYETLADLDVDAAWNAMLPAQATVPTEITFSIDDTAVIPVLGVSLGLALGAYVVLEGQNVVVPLQVTDIDEDEGAGETLLTVRVTGTAPSLPPADPAAGGFQLLVDPAAAEIRMFGWNADPVQFPPGALADPVILAGAASPRYGYDSDPVGGGTLGSQLLLSASEKDALLGQLVMLVDGGALNAYRVTDESSVTVTFLREEDQTVNVPTSITTSGNTTTINTTPQTVTLGGNISGAVTALNLRVPGAGADVTWSSFPIQGRLLARWRRALTVAPTRPNPAPLVQPLEVAADLDGMRPGRTLVLGTADGAHHAITLTSFALNPGGTWSISYTPDPAGLELGALTLFGNVARVSHGESVEQLLGGSDGFSPFQRFAVKKAPVSQIPGAAGATLAMEVRVDGIAWREVADFYGLAPEDRVYRTERAEDQTLTVIFGDGVRGAVPPAGRRNITAVYRVGLGRDGNVGDGRVSRIKKASPILDRAVNPLPVSGGAPPADSEAIRDQATRYIRTFDRAVSVDDYADLALLFPGIARAAARWRENDGIELVVADADGNAPEALEAVRAFLDARRDVTVPLTIAEPQPVDIAVSLALECDPTYLTEIVKLAAQDALYRSFTDGAPGLYTFAARDFAEPAHLSELIALITAIEGVETVQVLRFDLAGGTAVRDVIQATRRQWLRLKPENSDVAVSPKPPGDQAAAVGGTP